MSREQKVDGPRIDAPDLGVLEDGTLDVLEPGDDVEGLAFSGSRAETVSLRGGTVSNSTFTDCLVDELDLTSARVVDTRFRQVSVSVLRLHAAVCAMSSSMAAGSARSRRTTRAGTPSTCAAAR